MYTRRTLGTAAVLKGAWHRPLRSCNFEATSSKTVESQTETQSKPGITIEQLVMTCSYSL